ncbi:hypothetical protein [Limosilactobacillus oris]|uniref:hypothetical protein n=1 Tax=Limosilactobacillus oris TaxID=1632 RepID=UPI0024B385CC|nr:hypothetical protein [Limosilactobacillus oris]WHO86443.1 hypothetical protein QLX69_04380 [Limosilactobacillus oris]
MKIKEYVKKLYCEGFNVSTRGDAIRIRLRDMRDLVVDKKAQGWSNTNINFDTLSVLGYDKAGTLLELTKQYLRTPLSKRCLENKEYYLVAWRYYSGPIIEKGYVSKINISSDCSGFEYSDKPVPFTEDQLKNVKDCDPVLAPAIDAMKEEIKDEHIS